MGLVHSTRFMDKATTMEKAVCLIEQVAGENIEVMRRVGEIWGLRGENHSIGIGPAMTPGGSPGRPLANHIPVSVPAPCSCAHGTSSWDLQLQASLCLSLPLGDSTLAVKKGSFANVLVLI